MAGEKGKRRTDGKMCLFYTKQFGSKMCMRGEHMDSSSHGPMCGNYRAVHRNRNREVMVMCRAAHERDDVPPEVGFCVQVRV